MQVLLSIKPEFTDKIFEGSKKYEYRRTIFRDKDIKKVVVYASSPVSKVIGEFEIEQVLFDGLNDLWNKTKNYSGISKKYFLNYFANTNKGYAIKVKNYFKYKTPVCLQSKYGVLPPQSFLYLK
jgi:predicted transcriptional regulator